MGDEIGGRSAGSIDREGKSGAEDRIILAILGAVAFALVLVPLLLAALFFIITRYVMSRRGTDIDRLIVSTVAAFATITSVVFVRMGDLGLYMHWLVSRVGFGDLGWFQGPWPLVLALAGAMCCYALLLEGSRVMRWLPRNIGRVKMDRPSIIPDAAQRQKLANTTMPPGRVLPVPQRSVSSSSKGLPAQHQLVPLGLDARRQVVTLSVEELKTHMLVLGATGSGKSVTLMTLVAGMADLGMSGIVVDHKEDTKPGGMRDFLRDYAYSHQIEFQELRLSDPDSRTWFNPISQMGPDEMRDTILALMRFDDQYWQSLSKDLLTQLVNLLHYAHQVSPDQVPEPTLYEIGRLLKYGQQLPKATEKYRALVKQNLPHLDDKHEFQAIMSIEGDMAKNATGFGSKITQIYNTHAGRSVLRDGEGKSEIDVTASGLTYIGLDNQGKGDLTQAISAAILKKLSVYAAQRTTGVVAASQPRFLVIDEASVVNRELVKDLLARARSAGIPTILATQGPRDWIDEQGDDWNEMLNNINVLITMHMKDPVSAELCADAIGTEERLEVSQRVVEGYVVKDGTMRTKVDYRVPPEQIRSLGQGEAVVKVGIPQRYSFLRVALRDAKA